MKNPSISIILPMYNEEKYISECIESILNQTYSDYELIIIDDASTDDSLKKINIFNDSRIKLIYNKKNLGIAHSLNTGIQESRGQFIARIDANDIAINNRLEKQKNYLDKHLDCAAVFSHILNIDENGNSLGIIDGQYIPDELLQTYLFYKNCFFHTAVMMRKSCLPIPAYDVTNFAEDYNLWVDLLKKYDLHIIDEVLMKVRNLSSGLRYSDRHRVSNINVKFKQLEWLNIIPNEMEKAIHIGLNKKNRKINPKNVKNKLIWLDKLFLSNKKLLIFDEPYFTNKLVEHWNSLVNYIRTPISKPLFYYLIKSPLRKKTHKSIFRILIKFFPYWRSL